MTNIIVLLQLALSLLSNPQVQADPQTLAQVNIFVGQAISLAQETLSQSPQVPITVQSFPAQQTPVSTGGPSLPSVPDISPVVVVPRDCSLSAVDLNNNSLQVTWTSENVTLPGSLYEATVMDGGHFIFKKVTDLDESSGTIVIAKVIPVLKANFGGVECQTSL